MNVSSPNELKDLSIARRVAQHAASAPKSLAVQAGAETLTYGELELRSNRLACYLQSLDAGPDALVGIFLERSIDSVVSQLAVLKAGTPICRSIRRRRPTAWRSCCAMPESLP